MRWLRPSKRRGRKGRVSRQTEAPGQKRNRSRRARWYAVGIVCAIALAAVMIGAWYDLMWYERSWYIDARSGRVREDCFVLGLRVGTTIEATPFSALAQHYSLATRPPRWLLLHSRARSIAVLRDDKGRVGGER